MPALPKTGPSLFLGIELGIDQLRASIVDDSLDLVGVESIDFDTELPEYQTTGGIFTTPGEAYTTPIEMWLKGLDSLFEKLHRNYDLTKIKAISGAAQHALVWWKSTTVPSFSSLDPHAPLHSQFPAQLFSLPNTPVAQDTSSQTHGLAIESLLGGPDLMAARVGISANASMVAAQLLRVRETWPQEVWARTGRIQLASAFLASLISGKWTNMGEAEACTTGAWVHGAGAGAHPGSPHQTAQGHWDEGVLDIVGGGREEGRRVRGWLGDVDVSGSSRKAGYVSRYLAERYGFDPETIVAPFTSDFLASYLSLLPSPGDAVLSFGPIDTLLTPAQHYIPTRFYNLFPHPAQDVNEKRKYIAVLSSRNADVPRALVRDMYTKSWSAFDRLVAIVPPGGSIGLDDKLFSFWHLQPDAFPYARVKGIFRFETGIKVNEFRDLRANPRCLLESQILSFRVKWSRMIATGVLGSRGLKTSGSGSVSQTQTPPPLPTGQGRSNPITANVNANANANLNTISTGVGLGVGLGIGIGAVGLANLGLPFDPYDHSTLPTRVLATGAATNFPSMANLVCDIFHSPVFVPQTQVDSAQVVPHRNAPVQGYPSRAALGGCYLARWVWGREREREREWERGVVVGGGVGQGGGVGGFEEEVRRLLGKRWAATGGVALRTNVNGVVGPTPTTATTMGSLGSGGSGANSGTSTPYGHPGSRSGLGSTVFVEEEEDEEMERERSRLGLGVLGGIGGVVGGAGVIGGGVVYGFGKENGQSAAVAATAARRRTQTGSTVDTLSSSGTSSGGGGGGVSAPLPGSMMSMGPSTSSSSSSSAYTTPDLGLGSLAVMTGPSALISTSANGSHNINSNSNNSTGTSNNAGSLTPTTPTPLTPVVAMATSDGEVQVGLAKVAESDIDSFMSYAAIVPEFARLETMVVKGIV